MKTFVAKEHEIEKNWHLIDASDKVLGRLATEIANILRGKKKPIFTPHMDAGDYVVVVNAERVALTGDKLEKKTYYRWRKRHITATAVMWGGLRRLRLRKC